MTKDEKILLQIYRKVLDNKISINELNSLQYLEIIRSVFNTIKGGGGDLQTIYTFLMMCLDFYIYSTDGDVLISDADYDSVMNIYIKMGGQRIVYADYIGGTEWKMVEHQAPFMVGSIDKIYEYKDLYKYIAYIKEVYHNPPIVLAPKYDGVSSCVGITTHYIDWGITRGDGIKGQEISDLTRRIPNLLEVIRKYDDGFLKIEIMTTRNDFKKIQSIKNYKNRRSAVTGIINTPKNIDLGQFLSAIPLCWVSADRTKIDYCAPESITMREYYTDSKNPETNVIEQIHRMLLKIRDPEFPLRVDGVVIFPLINHDIYRLDIMKDAIAYPCTLR